jgi:hypothetical protein
MIALQMGFWTKTLVVGEWDHALLCLGRIIEKESFVRRDDSVLGSLWKRAYRVVFLITFYYITAGGFLRAYMREV